MYQLFKGKPREIDKLICALYQLKTKELRYLKMFNRSIKSSRNHFENHHSENHSDEYSIITHVFFNPNNHCLEISGIAKTHHFLTSFRPIHSLPLLRTTFQEKHRISTKFQLVLCE